MKYSYKLLGLLFAAILLVSCRLNAMFGVNLNELKSRLGKSPSAGKGAAFQPQGASVSPQIIQQFDSALKTFNVQAIEKIITDNPGLLTSAKAEVLKKTVAMRTSNIASREKLFAIFNFLVEKSDDVNLCDPIGVKPNALDAAIENLKKSQEEYDNAPDDNAHDQLYFYEGLAKTLIAKGGVLKKMANDNQAQSLVAKLGGAAQVLVEEPVAGVELVAEGKQQSRFATANRPMFTGRRKPSRGQRKGFEEPVVSVANENLAQKVDEVVQEARPILQKIKKTVRWDASFDDAIAVQEIVGDVRRSLKKGNYDLDILLDKVSEGIKQYSSNEKLTFLKTKLERLKREQQKAASERENAVQQEFERLMIFLTKPSTEDIDAIKDEINYVAKLPITQEQQSVLQACLNQLTLLQKSDALGVAIQDCNLEVAKNLLNENLELLNSTDLKFGYTPLMAAIAVKCSSENINRQRAMINYLLSLDGVDIFKTSDGKNSKNALDVSLTSIRSAQNNEPLKQHYQAIARQLIDKGLTLHFLKDKPEAQKMVVELSAESKPQIVPSQVIPQQKEKTVSLDIVALQNLPRYNPNENYYDVLGVSQGASSDQIKAAYRKLSLRLHPDKGGNAERFALLGKANEVLSNPEARAAYDQLLSSTPEQREQVQKDLNNLLTKLADEKNTNWDQLVDDVERILALPIEYEAKRQLKDHLEYLQVMQLDNAIAKLNIGRVKELLTLHSDFINVTDLQKGHTPLIKAISLMERSDKKKELIDYLLSVQGIDINKIAGKQTALDATLVRIRDLKDDASQAYYKAIAKMLIDRGAQLNLFKNNQKAQAVVKELVIGAPLAKPIEPKILGSVDQVIDQFKEKVEQKIKTQAPDQESTVPATTTIEQDIVKRAKKFGKQATERLKSKINAKINDQLERCVRQIEEEENKLKGFNAKKEALSGLYEKTLATIKSMKNEVVRVKQKIDRLNAKLKSAV